MENIDYILRDIKAERHYQNTQWGTKFDDKNTANDWVAYIVNQMAEGNTLPFDPAKWRYKMIKVSALAVAAIEAFDRNGTLPMRHYDGPDGTPTTSGRQGTNRDQ